MYAHTCVVVRAESGWPWWRRRGGRSCLQGRAGRAGRATSLYTRRDAGLAALLADALRDAGQPVPPWLEPSAMRHLVEGEDYRSWDKVVLARRRTQGAEPAQRVRCARTNAASAHTGLGTHKATHPCGGVGGGGGTTHTRARRSMHRSRPSSTRTHHIYTHARAHTQSCTGDARATGRACLGPSVMRRIERVEHRGHPLVLGQQGRDVTPLQVSEGLGCKRRCRARWPWGGGGSSSSSSCGH
jgi:hypothetical protein